LPRKIKQNLVFGIQKTLTDVVVQLGRWEWILESIRTLSLALQMDFYFLYERPRSWAVDGLDRKRLKG
jgi:hypothetical protein